MLYIISSVVPSLRPLVGWRQFIRLRDSLSHVQSTDGRSSKESILATISVVAEYGKSQPSQIAEVQHRGEPTLI